MANTNNNLRAGILIISDTASKDASTDRCIPTLLSVFEENDAKGEWHANIATKIVPDGISSVQKAITQWTDGPEALNLIVTSGGTGFAIKDSTPEAISPLLHRLAPGLVHGMLSESLNVTPFAMMARPVAGVRHETIIITLPGSPKGAKENLQCVIRLLPHACTQARGADSRVLHKGGVPQLEKGAGVNAAGKKLSSHDHGHEHHHGHSHGHNHGGHLIPKAHTDPSTRAQHQSNDPLAGPALRARESPYRMLNVPEALDLIASTVPAPQVITVPVNESLVGNILATDVHAAESVPAFRASIVDGYAVRCSSSGNNVKGVFPVAFASHAKADDETGIPELKDGEIARITTGAPLPPGSDAVVMVEDTTVNSFTNNGAEEREVEILTDELVRGENVREIGSDVKQGDIVMRAGEGVTAVGGEFGLLASVGTASVNVFKKPIVGVLSTGDEIVPHDRTGLLRLGEVRDTNRPTLLTAAQGTGFRTVDLGIASDTPGALESKLRAALSQVDVLITSGGVSMGELDLLKPTIERSLGGTIHFGRVSMKPGKPTTFATVPASNIKDPGSGVRDGGAGGWSQKVIFSLPGNPASAVVTYMLFVLPALHLMAGVKPAGLPRVMVKVDTEVRCDKVREEYHRVAVLAKEDDLWAISTGGQRSSRIGSFKGANALLRLPAGDGTLPKGSTVQALLMGQVGSVSGS